MLNLFFELTILYETIINKILVKCIIFEKFNNFDNTKAIKTEIGSNAAMVAAVFVNTDTKVFLFNAILERLSNHLK
tara:strand:- start:188 stop:415 length:228 start_codon:yes stop_codon:yes gene_type:complete